MKTVYPPKTKFAGGGGGGYNKTKKTFALFLKIWILIDFLLTVKAATLIFISGGGSAISSAKQGKSGSI